MPKQETLGEFLGLQPEQPVEEAPRPSLFDTLTIKDFCKGVLASREYRKSILDRITLGSLPPAVECRMYDYAYGKPVEKIEWKDTTDPLDDFTPAQLEDRASQLLDLARQLKSESSSVLH